MSHQPRSHHGNPSPPPLPHPLPGRRRRPPESLRERLTVQFRMHPQIMKMINCFYDNQLTYTEEPKDHQHFVTFNSKYNNLVTSDKHLLWVDTSYDEKGMACLDEDRTNITEAKLIAQALEQLSPRQREIFELSRNRGLSHKEIAEQLGLSVYTVQDHIKNALEKIRAYLIPFISACPILVSLIILKYVKP